VEEAVTLLLIAPTLRELLLRPDRIELAEDSDRVKGGPKDALELVYPLSEYALGGAPKVLDLGSGPWRWEPDRKGSEAEKLEPPKPEEKL
jgi:hypothetical protein